MHIHILGICGTFMGGIALLARQAGHTVSGSDANVYPPMSTQLQEQGITLMEGYEPAHLDCQPDQVVVGNVMSRGMPIIERVLNENIPYTSGPQWLAEHVLRDRWVLAVAGTHGKTTTSSMLAWIMEYAGLTPGYLIGGVPENFGLSARLGEAPFFVVEADEYDTAFFDKRSKFVHYHPRTLVMNNLEFDHADIFDDLAAIQKQFHHLVRTVPSEGLIISHQDSPALQEVIGMGCWTPLQWVSTQSASKDAWHPRDVSDDASRFRVNFGDDDYGSLDWTHLGLHNISNALGAIAAARHAGVPVGVSLQALTDFKGVKRRLELKLEHAGVRLYDDFAHHPTAIKTTLQGLRGHVGTARIWVLLEPRSNTMRLGIHKDQLAQSLSAADAVCIFQPDDLGWDLAPVISSLGDKAALFSDVDAIVEHVRQSITPGDYVVVMSNGGFSGIHAKLEAMLKSR